MADHSLHAFHIEEAERAKIIAQLVVKEQEIVFAQKYPTIAGVIEGEWDEKVVNIEYFSKCVVEWIEDRVKDGYTYEELEDIYKHTDWAPVNAILLCFEPDCINGTSYRGAWIHSNKPQLVDLNRDLVKAYKTDNKEWNMIKA